MYMTVLFELFKPMIIFLLFIRQILPDLSYAEQETKVASGRITQKRLDIRSHSIADVQSFPEY